MKKRFYLDTSVIGGCIDEEFEEWSNKLISEIRHGEKIAAQSELTLRELELAPEKVREKLQDLPSENIDYIIIGR